MKNLKISRIRQKAKGKRQKAKGKRQKARGKRQEAKGKRTAIIRTAFIRNSNSWQLNLQQF
ncbi:hypothetical protein [Dactylococcopsis salina]|uniref:hypothetical protein n=1 Tax=Dactylococcopsis salina TaxID=292566 RepID=UPI0002D76AE1|nr:hypothetical protein [Dactylococcopsis salina]